MCLSIAVAVGLRIADDTLIWCCCIALIGMHEKVKHTSDYDHVDYDNGQTSTRDRFLLECLRHAVM